MSTGSVGGGGGAETVAEAAARRVRRNFNLGVANGALWILGRALIDPDTVLPAFAVALMGDNPLAVGLLVSLVNAGWFWPPLLMTSTMATRRRRHPYYKLSAVVRVVALFSAWLVTHFLAGHVPGIAFVAIALIYLVYTSGGGMGLVPFMSVVTDSVPADLRGRFFAMRFFLGGLLAFAAGFGVKWVLSDTSGLSFPDNYALLFAAATVIAAISLGAWWFAWEPPHKTETRHLPLLAQLRRGLRRLRREPNFLRFVTSRVLLAASMGMITPFLVPFGYRDLGMTPAMVGLALSAGVLSDSMFNILWSRLSVRWGNRLVLLVSCWAQMGAIVLALTVPLLPALPVGQVLGLPFDLRLAAMLLVFAAAGASKSGQGTGHNAYLLDVTPERTRPVYMATYYVLVLPFCFMPLLTGALIGATGRYALVFALGGLLTAANLLTYRKLADLHTGNGAEHGVVGEGARRR